MTRAAATPPRATALDRRAFARARCQPGIRRAVVIGLATVTGAGVMAAAATMAGALMAVLALGTPPHFKVRSPIALDAGAPAEPHGVLAGAADLSGLAGFSSEPADGAPALPALASAGTDVSFDLFSALPALAGAGVGQAATLALPGHPSGATRDPESISLTAVAFSPTSLSRLPAHRSFQRTSGVRSPPALPIDVPQIEARRDAAAVAAEPASPQAADAPSLLADVLQKRAPPPQARNNAISLPDADGRTAIYDIEAHTVYLPSGVRLEAHSGLGRRLDDPRHVNEKDRGATPPNVYDLALRDQLFHGVRAIRLNPVGDGRMFGRDGILAHTYMLGPSGQSFGCVSFKNYPEFLKAFLRGEIDRLVVVPRLETKT